EYQITATPGHNSLFGGWIVAQTNGAFTHRQAVTNFIMESSLRITAHFETNMFLAGAGTYNGLFAVVSSNGTVDVAEQTAGLLGGLLVGTNGSYSGKLWINGGSHAVSGSFSTYNDATNTYGSATNKVVLPGGDVLL